MRVRCYWRNCDYRNGKWGALPVDAFWVEATKEEATTRIFPLLTPERIATAEHIAERYGHMAEMMGNVDGVYCFLVARDLTSIDPFQPHYPVANLWNAYSPFRTMPEIEVNDLEELRDVELPQNTET